MAQLNITLDQDEILQVLGDSCGDAFRLLLQESLNALLMEENDRWAASGRLYYAPSRDELESKEMTSRLEGIARNQRLLREAA